MAGPEGPLLPLINLDIAPSSSGLTQVRTGLAKVREKVEMFLRDLSQILCPVQDPPCPIGVEIARKDQMVRIPEYVQEGLRVAYLSLSAGYVCVQRGGAVEQWGCNVMKPPRDETCVDGGPVVYL